MKKWSGLALCVLGVGCGASNSTIPSNPTGPMTFFVSSTTSVTGNLGGLRGADATCQQLATAAGAGGHTWRAYLSAEHDPDNGGKPVDARSRIVPVHGAMPTVCHRQEPRRIAFPHGRRLAVRRRDWTTDQRAVAGDLPRRFNTTFSPARRQMGR